MTPVLQPGARLSLEWTARLEEHIGTFRVDPIGARTAAIMADRAALAALGVGDGARRGDAAGARRASGALRPHARPRRGARRSAPDWPARYAAWELALLAELGFGLDLAACAVTGATEDLVWVSPRIGAGGQPRRRRGLGRAAAAAAGLPARRLGRGAAGRREVAEALALTGHFLEARVAPGLPREALPAARGRAVEAIVKLGR